MKNGFEVVNDVRALINVQPVLGLITGAIYPGQRPSNSTKSDIVVRTNGGTNSQDQAFYVYINCYYPSISSTIDGKLQSLPDYAKLSTLAKAIEPLVDSQFKATFRCWVDETANLVQDSDGSFFISIRVRYQSIQENYKNI